MDNAHETCCHRTRIAGAPCPAGRVCPHDTPHPAVIDAIYLAQAEVKAYDHGFREGWKQRLWKTP